MHSPQQPLAQIARLLLNDGLVATEEELSDDPTVSGHVCHLVVVLVMAVIADYISMGLAKENHYKNLKIVSYLFI